MKSNTRYAIIKSSVYYALAAFFLLFEMGVQSSPSVMASHLMTELNMDAAVFGTAMGLYFLSYTLMQIPVGLLFDRQPAKRLLLIAVAVCAFGAYVFSLSHSLFALGISRFLTGFGSSFAFVGVLVIANQWFSARYFALLVGVAQWVAALGAMAGEMPLAYWVKVHGWRTTSVLLALIGFGLFALMVVILKDKPISSDAKLSLPSPIKSLANIVRNKQTAWIAVYAFTAWSPIALFAELWGVPYLIVKLHVSNIVAAKYCSVIWIGLAFASPVLGGLSDRLSVRRYFLVICSAIGLFGAVIVIYLPASMLSGWGTVILIVGLVAFGVAAAGQILCFALVRDNFPKHDLAVAIGVINMAVVIGGAIFQPAVGLLLHWHSHLAHAYQWEDYRFALSVIPAVYLLGLIVSVLGIRDVA